MRGVIYARYSSDAQREESIDAQIRENKVFAERHGIEIVGTYIDRALSAKTDNRPEFQRMIKDRGRISADHNRHLRRTGGRGPRFGFYCILCTKKGVSQSFCNTPISHFYGANITENELYQDVLLSFG